MGADQGRHVLAICNEGSTEVSQHQLVRLEQLDLGKKTLGSFTVNKDKTKTEKDT